MISAISACLFGLAQGVRHAFEPDHLVAVSTFVAGQRSARSSAFFALAWGLGHALMLTFACGVLIVLEQRMPESMAQTLEFAVSVVLVLLGGRALREAVQLGKKGKAFRHRHAKSEHRHAGTPDHVHALSWTLARRPLVVGLVHGLAGSGALTALILSRVQSRSSGLTMVLLYGIGAAVGMALLGGAIGLPLSRLAHRRAAMSLLVGSSGVASIVIGIYWSVRLFVSAG
jgi:hypothetical protein